MTDTDSPRRVKSVDNAFAVLERLGRRRETTLSALSEDIDLSKGALHTYLATLRANGVVEKENGRYRLGPRLLVLGETFRNQEPLYHAGRGQIDKLAFETRECAHLIIEHAGKTIVLYEKFGEDAVGTEYHTRWREEAHGYLHCTAAGKAIFAHMPEAERDAILETEELVKTTPKTRTDEAEVREMLDAVRDRGFALNDEEEVRGMRAVGAPVFGPTGDVRGAISLTAPRSRLRDEDFYEKVPEEVMEAANVIEINLQTDEQAVD